MFSCCKPELRAGGMGSLFRSIFKSIFLRSASHILCVRRNLRPERTAWEARRGGRGSGTGTVLVEVAAGVGVRAGARTAVEASGAGAGVVVRMVVEPSGGVGVLGTLRGCSPAVVQSVGIVTEGV